MRKCVICAIDFKNLCREICCSIKCKILEGIKKQENGCWLYKQTASGPYGKIRWKAKWYSAHRSSYEVFIGPIEEGKWICHKCDVPKCVNPEHLFKGSPSENRKDCFSKKRAATGQDSNWSKFNDIQVQEMRLLKQEGFTFDRIARIFNCSFTYISKITKQKIRKE